MNIVQKRPWVDVAVIEIVNIGRAPISLSSISLDVGADPRWRLRRRHTVGMVPIAVHGGLADITEVRLEAAQSAFAILDLWTAVESARKMRQRVHVRASVLPAGRRAKRSPWRHRWTVGQSQQHLWPFGPEGDQVLLFQAVWRAIAPIKPSAVYEAWLAITGLLIAKDVDLKGISISEVSDKIDRFLVLTRLQCGLRSASWTPYTSTVRPVVGCRLEEHAPAPPDDGTL